MKRGMLQYLVIIKLAEKPKSGYTLVKEIEQSTGHKPSFGSIYPLLNKLVNQGFVTFKEEGRKKIYCLTAAGRSRYKKISEQKQDFLKRMEKDVRCVSVLLGISEKPFTSLLNHIREDKPPLGNVSGNMFKLRNIIFEMAADGSMKNHEEEINKLLKEMICKVEKMQ